MTASRALDIAGLVNDNVLMSLPTCLIHCVLSEWLEVISVIGLDVAFSGVKGFHSQLLDILKSSEFYVHDAERKLCWKGQSFSAKCSLEWFIRRQVKIVDLVLHQGMANDMVKTYLQAFGQHVRHVRPGSDVQRSLVEKYCPNITSYVYQSHDVDAGCLIRVLNSTPRLEMLYLECKVYGRFEPTLEHPIPTLAHLTQIEWFSKYGFDDKLPLLARMAPNLNQLSIRCVLHKCAQINGNAALDVARACPHLRTLSCIELDIGPYDSFLQPFLAKSSGIINLDVRNHANLTDEALIGALGELHQLKCLDLRGCCMLTDTTLEFLSQRFASTLQILYLDYSESYDEDVQGGYTAKGIANLRVRCSQLHTFHFFLKADLDIECTQRFEAYQSATTLEINTPCAAILPIVIEHCQQMQILVIDQWSRTPLNVNAEQLMTIVANCRMLHTVVYPKKNAKADYCAVKKMFPKLRFSEFSSELDFDILEVPV